jgi:hypothetical protein
MAIAKTTAITETYWPKQRKVRIKEVGVWWTDVIRFWVSNELPKIEV